MKPLLHLPHGWQRQAIVRILGALFLAGLCSCASAAELTVTVVLSDRSEIYQAFFTSLQNKLNGSNIRLVAADVQEPIRNPGLIVVAGVRAANALPASTNAPVLYALVPKSRFEVLEKQRRQSGAGARDSALYLEQPVERQLRLLAAALPDHRRVGVLSSAATGDEIEALSRDALRYNLKIQSAEVSEQAGLAEILPGVLENSDVLLALPDTAIYNSNTIRNLLFSSYRSGKPIVGFSAGFVKAGAVMAVYSTPEQYGEQVAAMIERYAGNGALPPPQYSQAFDVSVNKVVAGSMGLNLEDASTLKQKLARQEKVAP